MKHSFFGLNKKEVEREFEKYEDKILLQQRDIAYLKQDNASLTRKLAELSTELDHRQNGKRLK